MRYESTLTSCADGWKVSYPIPKKASEVSWMGVTGQVPEPQRVNASNRSEMLLGRGTNGGANERPRWLTRTSPIA